MKPWVRALFAVTLVAFAAGTAIQAAQATVMDVTMSLADDGGGCSYCPMGTDDGSMTCASACLVPVVGVTGFPAKLVRPALAEVPGPYSLQSMSGWIAPPNPYPPRTVVLS